MPKVNTDIIIKVYIFIENRYMPMSAFLKKYVLSYVSKYQKMFSFLEYKIMNERLLFFFKINSLMGIYIEDVRLHGITTFKGKFINYKYSARQITLIYT